MSDARWPETRVVVVLPREPERTILSALAQLLTSDAATLLLPASLSTERHSDWANALSATHTIDAGAGPLASLPTLPMTLLQQSTREAENAPRLVVLTSGSTGDSKGVVLSERSLFCSAHGLLKRFPFTPEHRWLLDLPLWHVGGVGIVVRAMVGGGEVVWREPSIPLAAQIERDQVTHLSVVPTQLHRLLETSSTSGWSDSLQVVMIGGGPVSPTLWQRAIDAGLPVVASYGLTEMASTVYVRFPDGRGEILPDRHLDIDEEGQVRVGGATRCWGYLHLNGTRQQIAPNELIVTGDLGDWSAEGTLMIHGRVDRQFVCGGENIVPEMIERVLCETESVREAVVVPVLDAEFGHLPVAFVDSDVSIESISETLGESVRLSLGSFFVPRAMYALPRSPAGLLKPSLADLAGEAARRYSKS